MPYPIVPPNPPSTRRVLYPFAAPDLAEGRRVHMLAGCGQLIVGSQPPPNHPTTQPPTTQPTNNPTTQQPNKPPGLGLTPPLGYNAYDHVGCCANETTMKQQGNALITTGLFKLGC